MLLAPFPKQLSRAALLCAVLANGASAFAEPATTLAPASATSPKTDVNSQTSQAATPADEPAESSAGEPTEQEDNKVHWLRIAVEQAIDVAVGSVWYWSQTSLQKADWELDWDWPSWRVKLTEPTESIRFDTNGFSYNAINHPFAGAINYQIARTNGLGPTASIAYNIVWTMFWEYFVEFKEIISLNDLIVNTSTGLSVGESLLQVGDMLQSSSHDRLSGGFGLLVSPFGAVHRYLDGKGRPRWSGWRKVEYGLRGAMPWNNAGVKPLEAVLGINFEAVKVRGASTAGSKTTKIKTGTQSLFAAELAFVAKDPSAEQDAANFFTRTSLWGRHQRNNFETEQGIFGDETLWSLATGFTYDTRQLAEEHDLLAVAHLIGGQFSWWGYHGNTRIHWDNAVFIDFDMISAYVFGPNPPFDDMLMPPASALQAHGYYFGWGGTAESRLSVQHKLLSLAASLRAHAAFSIDGADRRELGDANDPHGVSDQRVFARLQLGVKLGQWPTRIDAVIDGAWRHGAWQKLDRSDVDAVLGLQVTFVPGMPEN